MSTTSTIIAQDTGGSPAQLREAQVTVPGHRLAVTFPRTLRSEWIKLWTVRSSVLTVIGAVIAMIGFGAIGSAVAAGDITPPNGQAGPGAAVDPVTISLIGTQLAQIIFGVLGVLIVTNEFSNGMARVWYTAVPRRLPVLWAKAALMAGVVVVAGTLSSFAAFFVGQLISGSGTTLADDGVLRAVLGSGLYLAGVAVLGVAVGYLLRHTAGSIAVLFASLLVVPGLLSALLPDSWADAITPILPTNAGAAFTSVNPADNLLTPGAGALVFVAWIVVLLGASAWRVKAKDA